MDAENKETVPPEIRVTATLLIDTEKKIEELRNQLNSMEKAESPTLAFNPPSISNGSKKDVPIARARAETKAKITDLTNRSLQIVEEIEKGSSSETSKRVGRLKQDWIKDLEPAKVGETKSILESQKWANRKLNKDWTALEQPEEIQTPLQQNKEDMVSKKASYLDKARGLKDDYAYLEKDIDAPVPGKDKGAPGLEPIQPDGPDIDIDKD